jgi:hypothetical protein
MGKYKFFFWLPLKDRLNARDLLKRKNMELPDTCVLCNDNKEEDLLHLFFEYLFNKWCWRFVHVHWNTTLSPQDMFIASRRRFDSIIFKEVIMIALCSLDNLVS